MDENEGIWVGKVVHYVLNQSTVDSINAQRIKEGGQRGNSVSIGDHVPMMIIRIWPNEYGDEPGVNGQCFLDGVDSLWVTSAREDKAAKPGTWHFVEAESW